MYQVIALITREPFRRRQRYLEGELEVERKKIFEFELEIGGGREF